MEKYIPADHELPDRVAYVAKFDLSNEKAADNEALLKQFKDSGRLGGIQFLLSVEAGTRQISTGISYYDNPDGPRKLLLTSGDPANHTGPNRFEVPGLGDAYIAQRGQVGSGEAALHLINLVWVRGPFYISMFDVGGAPDKPTDIAIAVARQIDAKLQAMPAP